MNRTMDKVFNKVMESIDKKSKPEEVIVTAYDVVQKRQIQLLEETNKLKAEREELVKRLNEIDKRNKEINLEYKLLESGLSNESRMVYTEKTITIETHSGRKLRGDRMDFEQTLRKIFEAAGRPMAMVEIITELERFQYEWSDYQAAYKYIRNCNCIESTGARGYYQLSRSY